MTDADLLDDLVFRIVRLKCALGSDAYREAVFRAAMAVARVALAEAEGRSRRERTGNVVRFPGRRNGEPESGGTG